MRIALLALILAAANVAADTDIHRCQLEDGTYSFQEKPCADPAAKADGADAAPVDDETDDYDPVLDFVNPFDEPQSLTTQEKPPEHERPSKDRAECEKSARDAIDAIDLEMRETNYTEEQGRQFLAELLKLTRQLRECKS